MYIRRKNPGKKGHGRLFSGLLDPTPPKIADIRTLQDPKSNYYDKKLALRGLGVVKEEKELPKNATLKTKLRKAVDDFSIRTAEHMIFGPANIDRWKEHHEIN